MLGGIFQRNDEERSVGTLPWGDWTDTNAGSWAGMRTDRDSAMQLLAVHGSVRMISESISTMPPGTYREEGPTRVKTESPRWLKYPSNDLDWVSWMSQVMTGLLLDGNAYISVTRRTNSDEISELVPIATNRVLVQTENRRKVIRVDGAIRRKGSVLHVPGMMFPGEVKGLSPLEYARQTVGLGLAATQFGSEYFERDGNMPGVIELPRPANPETMRKMASQWKAMRTRSGRGLPGVLDDSAQWKPTGVTSEQMQFLQTRQYSGAEIAGQLFNLDPADLGIPVPGSSLSYANLDQRNVRRLQVTFLPHIVRLEKALTELLPGRQFLKLGTDALLRGDTKSRYDGYKIALDAGFLSVDEVRELEDRRPLPPEATEPDPDAED